MSTTTVYAGSGDNSCNFASSSGWSESVFNALRAGATGSGVRSGATLRVSILARSSGTSYFERAFFPFDTSVISDTDVISAGSIFLHQSSSVTSFPRGGSESNLQFCESTQSSPTTLDTADYDQVGDVSFSSQASFNAAAYTEWVLNASGIANINKAGWSLFALRHGQDLANIYLSTTGDDEIIFYTSDETGTSKDPYITVTHASAASGNIKKINNIAWANVKKVNNIAVANIKKINGIAAK